MYSYFMYIRVTVDDYVSHQWMVVHVDDKILTGDDVRAIEKQLMTQVRRDDCTLDLLRDCNHHVSITVENLSYLGRID